MGHRKEDGVRKAPYADTQIWVCRSAFALYVEALPIRLSAMTPEKFLRVLPVFTGRKCVN